MREKHRKKEKPIFTVDLLEFLDGEVPGGAVLEEALVPLLDLLVGELRVVAQVLQLLRLQLAALASHRRC